MPHITTAMEWSRRRGVGELLVDSFLRKRSIADQAMNVKESFSSWSSCMQASYCKWPIIAAIIVGGLIVLSVAWCIIRCACCGMSCCCTCFSFLKCCDCCGGCCDGKRDRPHKHLDDYPPPNPNQGYKAPAPMMGGALPARPEQPQYAQFEVGKNGFAVNQSNKLSEDALPPMPTWGDASKVHVREEEKDEKGMELGELDPITGQQVPFGNGGIDSHPNSPAVGKDESPYGRQVRGMNNGFVNRQDSYNRSQNNVGNGRGFGQGGSPNPRIVNDPLSGYRGTPPPMGPGSQLDGMRHRGSPGPGPMGYRGTPPPGNPGFRSAPSPGPGMIRGPGQFRSAPSSAPNRIYSRPTHSEDFEPAIPQEFPSPTGFNDAPVGGLYPSQPSRQFSNDSSRPLIPGRSYTNNTDQSYNSYQSDDSSNTGTYPHPHTLSAGHGANGSNRMMSPAPQNGGYRGPGPQQRGFNNSPAPIDQFRFPQKSGHAQGHDEYTQFPQRNMSSTPQQQQSRTPTFKPYNPDHSPEPEVPAPVPAYPGYKPYTPAPR